MSIACRRSFVSDLSTTEQAAVLAHPDATYSLQYFETASAGSTARDLLAFGKASWKNRFLKVMSLYLCVYDFGASSSLSEPGIIADLCLAPRDFPG